MNGINPLMAYRIIPGVFNLCIVRMSIPRLRTIFLNTLCRYGKLGIIYLPLFSVNYKVLFLNDKCYINHKIKTLNQIIVIQ